MRCLCLLCTVHHNPGMVTKLRTTHCQLLAFCVTIPSLWPVEIGPNPFLNKNFTYLTAEITNSDGLRVCAWTFGIFLCKESVGVRNLREAERMNLPTFYKMRARGPTDDSLFLLSIFLCPFALLAFGIRFCSEREKGR